MHTSTSKQLRVQIVFPLITKGNSQHPYGLATDLLCWEILIRVKAWHGMANQAKPLNLMRRTKAKLDMKPSTKLTSWNTGSFAMSNPCLRSVALMASEKMIT